MARSALQYRQLLLSLLPPGKVWQGKIDRVLVKTIYAIADEFVRVEERVEALFEEKDVRTTTELLEDHENDYSLPDEGDEIGKTTEKRREELHASLLKLGQQYKQYYIDIAAALGYTIRIEEFTPFWAGLGQAGDACGDQFNLFKWIVWIDESSVTRSIEVNIKKLKFKIEDTAPAHTCVFFRFDGIEYDRAFSSAFDSIPSFDRSWLNGEYSRDFDNSFANAYDYDGENWIGAFSQAFGLSFDRHSGGNYNTEFSVDFSKLN
jgi:uncharacterized protein YmfQ (DUF2313 family)